MKTIMYKVSYEKMISRIPGLFAYIGFSDDGSSSLHKATDSHDGCWGKIVENIALPQGSSLVVDGSVLLSSGKTYTYRTVIDHYYRYRSVLPQDNAFVMFVEKGIGKVSVPQSVRGEATPEVLYLANAKMLHNILVKMGKQCSYYEQNKDVLGDDKHLCCLCERYKAVGGDRFRDYVAGLISQADDTASEYIGYASSGMTIDLDIDLTSTYQDYGILTPYMPAWIPGKRYMRGDKVQYDGDVYICTRENTGKWDDDYLRVVFDDSCFEKAPVDAFDSADYSLPYSVEGTTDSKLSDMRRFATYYNDDNVAERPLKGYDWLFYYRKGTAVNIRTVNDALGNVVRLSDMTTASTDKDDLAAYGDVITSIEKVQVERKIKFTYIQGVHLKADSSPTVILDDDRNELIKWGRFIWDGDEKKGIKYEETYNYEEGGELDRLIQGTFSLEGVSQTFTFDRYIEGEYDRMLPSCKFEFVTYNSTFNYSRMIANQDATITSVLTDFTVERENLDEYVQTDFYRDDYLNGITFQPKKEIDVNIQRGSTSVFDKHIALGEVKTLNDMEQYKNSSFFRMTEG